MTIGILPNVSLISQKRDVNPAQSAHFRTRRLRHNPTTGRRMEVTECCSSQFFSNSIMKCNVHFAKFCTPLSYQWHDYVPRIFERMTKEPTALAPPTMNVQVVAPPERRYWYGVFSQFSALDLEGRVRLIWHLQRPHCSFVFFELAVLAGTLRNNSFFVS